MALLTTVPEEVVEVDAHAGTPGEADLRLRNTGRSETRGCRRRLSRQRDRRRFTVAAPWRATGSRARTDLCAIATLRGETTDRTKAIRIQV